MLANRVDRNGGICYNQFDRVRQEKTWRQVLQKEADQRAENVANGATVNFQMNLANLCGTSGLLRLGHSHNRIEIVTEKEHKQTPDARRSLKGMNPSSFEVLAIKHLGKTPGLKWDLPELSSHEYGWMQGDFVRAHTMSPAKTQNSFFGAVGKASTAGRASASTRSEPPVGSLAHASLGSATSQAVSQAAPSKRSIVIVANDHILRRIQSAPHLPTGKAPQTKELNNAKWKRPKVMTDVTSYAEVYQTLMKHSPYNQSAAGR